MKRQWATFLQFGDGGRIEDTGMQFGSESRDGAIGQCACITGAYNFGWHVIAHRYPDDRRGYDRLVRRMSLVHGVEVNK